MDFIKLLTYGLEYFGLYYGTYKGVVTANNDPDGLGRLQVHCPTIHGTETAQAWAWPIAPMAGKQSGLWHVPDVGEWVSVQFDHGRLEYPLWTGGWWGAPSNTSQSYLQRNQQWATPGPWTTTLSSSDEATFQQWVKSNNVPWINTPDADYDMRGFWKGLTTGDPRAQTQVNQNDGLLHFTDTWKTPYHKSFSNESMYATPDAPHWTNDTDLVDNTGQVIFSEAPGWSDTDKSSDMNNNTVVLCTKEGLKIVLDRQAKSILLQQNPGNSVLIDSSGIVLNHQGNVKINAQGEVDITAQTKLKVSAPETDITGTVNITGNVNVTGAGVIKPAPWTTPVP